VAVLWRPRILRGDVAVALNRDVNKGGGADNEMDIYPGGIPMIPGTARIRDAGSGEIRTFEVWAGLHAQQFRQSLEWGREQIIMLIQKRAMFIVDSDAGKASVEKQSGKAEPEK
jgi:hypothetical protein